MSENNKAEIKDIVRSDASIRAHIIEQVKAKDLQYSDLIDAAEKKEINLSKSSLSRYLNNAEQVQGIPTQEAILFLCKHLKIKVSIHVEPIFR